MPTNERSTASVRLGSISWARFALAASAALLGVGIAVHGGVANGKLGSVTARTPSDALVNVLGDDDLAKFEVVDMADALDRVAGADRVARDAAK